MRLDLLNSLLITLVSSLASEVALRFISEGGVTGYTLTFADLAIHPYAS